MTDPYAVLQSAGITLPPAVAPVASFVPWVRSGNLLFLSGHIARRNGRPWTGQLGDSVTTGEGQQAARATVIDLLATLHAALGDLNQVRRIVKVMVLVNSGRDFIEQHVVANGASDLLAQVFGDRGAHARSAFGVAQIPFGACVEIDMLVELTSEALVA
jgi:enamine deaminase RidA (YjgF/YER057c/UK114 family)